MISPLITRACRVIVVKSRSWTFSLFFCRMVRATERLTLAPECVRIAPSTTTPDAARTILVCGIRTASYDADGKRRGSRGMRGRKSGRKRPKLLESDDVCRRPRETIYKRNSAPSVILYFTRFPRAAVQRSIVILCCHLFSTSDSASVIVI